MSKKLLSCENVTIGFGGEPVLDDVSFNLSRKEIVTIIGPNGSGKTTLLQIICGLKKADSGSVFIENDAIIGYMPQKLMVDRVFPLTVRRFLRLNGKENKLRNVDDVEKVAKDFGILHLMKQQVHNISGGEMQRVMLTRAILLNPDLLVLDEPTQGLDIQGQAEFYRLIGDVREKTGCGILIVSHDLHMVMAATDRVVCINQHVCCEGKPEDVNDHPEYLALFGKQAAENVALYMHHHDHTHGVDGHVKGENNAG